MDPALLNHDFLYKHVKSQVILVDEINDIIWAYNLVLSPGMRGSRFHLRSPYGVRGRP